MTAVPLDRVLVVMMSALGDAVHTLPVITAIKRHSRASRISWIVQPGPAELVRGHPAVDELIVYRRRDGLRAAMDVLPRIRRQRFDVALNLQAYLKGGLVSLASRADVKLGFDRARARDLNWLFTTHRLPPHAPQHMQDQFLEFLEWLGVPTQPMLWNLGPWEHERAMQAEFFAPFDRPVAAIVVATSRPEKDWMPERWAAVCDQLFHDAGLLPVLVGGTSEREVAAQRVIAERSRAPVVSALGGGLRRLVAILDGAALALSPDTGPLHMSVALDRPVISLMGATNPALVGPYRRFHDLLIDRYGDPGDHDPRRRVSRTGRMDQITVQDVMDRVTHWHATYRTTHPPRRGAPPVTARWVHCATFASPLEAEMARQLLDAEGIPVLIKGDVPGVFGGAFQGNVPSGVELQVPDAALEHAREILGDEDE